MSPIFSALASSSAQFHAAGGVEGAPSLTDVQAAMLRLHRFHLATTPLLPSPDLAAQISGQVWLKAEHRQVTGSFKLRGALNRLLQFNEAERQAGVVSYSSGNFGIAVAFGGWNLGIPVTIVVPQDAPAAKLHKIRLMGAKIVLADRTSDNRIQLARDLAQQTGAVLLPFADQPQVIAGAGTVVLEMLEQLRAQSLDTVLVPCGGGSLTAGSALVLQSLSPKTRVIAVEPVGLDDTARSLAAGKILANDPAARSICDSLLTRQPSPLTFAMLQAGQAANQLACMAVEDIAVQHAVVWLAKRLHQVVEPGGAIALAALLSQPQNFVGQRVGVLLTGANG